MGKRGQEAERYRFRVGLAKSPRGPDGDHCVVVVGRAASPAAHIARRVLTKGRAVSVVTVPRATRCNRVVAKSCTGRVNKRWVQRLHVQGEWRDISIGTYRPSRCLRLGRERRTTA